jgi:hypothetical protein
MFIIASAGHDLDIGIVGKLLGDGFHGLCVRDEDRSFIGQVERLRIRVALGESPDQRLLDWGPRAGIFLRLLQRMPRDCGSRLGHHRQVLVRAHSECHAPPAARALRIELRGIGEGTRRLIMVEGPKEPHP